MRFICETSSGGVRERLFTHGEIPGVLWTSEGAAGTCPLIVMGHGGGQHKKAPGLVTLARRFVAECGFAVVAADVPGHGAGRRMSGTAGSRPRTRPAWRPERNWLR